MYIYGTFIGPTTRDINLLQNTSVPTHSKAKYTKDHSHHVDIRLIRKQIIRTQPAGLVNGEEATTSNSLGVYVTLSI